SWSESFAKVSSRSLLAETSWDMSARVPRRNNPLKPGLWCTRRLPPQAARREQGAHQMTDEVLAQLWKLWDQAAAMGAVGLRTEIQEFILIQKEPRLREEFYK